LCVLEDGDATPARASRRGVRGARFVTLRRAPLLAGDAPPPSRADAFGSRETAARRALFSSMRDRPRKKLKRPFQSLSAAD